MVTTGVEGRWRSGATTPACARARPGACACTVQVFAGLRELAGRRVGMRDSGRRDAWRSLPRLGKGTSCGSLAFFNVVSCARNEDFARMNVRETASDSIYAAVSGGAGNSRGEHSSMIRKDTKN